MRRSGAFTLIESLLVIAIIAVLLVLLVPMLGHFKREANHTVALSRLRQHAQVFAVYAGDHAEQWPLPTDPEATRTLFYWSDRAIPVRYFGAHAYWPLALAADYYGSSPVQELFRYPGEEPWLGSDYRYSCAFIADPAFWDGATRRGPTQWRATAVHEVLFPSRKALLDTFAFRAFHTERQGVNGPTFERHEHSHLTAFADASARRIPLRELAAPYPRGDGRWEGSAHPGGVPMLDTVNGLRGVDVK